MSKNTTNNPLTIYNQFSCHCCDYNTLNKKDFNKHLLTRKHEKNEKYYKNPQNLTTNTTIVTDSHKFYCDCGKKYMHRSSLYNHKKKCSILKGELGISPFKDNSISNDIIIKLIEENSEIKTMLFKQFENIQEQQNIIQTQMMEQQKQMSDHISELIPKVGNNNTINNKQNFNMHIFLNEQCKDALTINEFIDKMHVTMDDLILTKNKGITEGVSNIFMENMNKLSLHERPMHCTDVKRETVYIKSSGDIIGGKEEPAKWGKDEENRLLKQAISKVGHIQRKNLDLWKEAHPNWENNSDEQTEYMMLVKNSTDDLKENKREEKVIKKLCNKVYIKGEVPL